LLEALDVMRCLLVVLRCVLRYVLVDVEGGLCLREVLEVLEVPEVMRCVLLYMLVAVEGGLRLLEVPEVPEVIRCVLRYMLEVVEGGLCLREVLEPSGTAGSDALCAARYAGGCGGWALFARGAGGSGDCWGSLAPREVIRCVPLCMVETVEGGLCSLEVLEVPEAMRCVLLCILEVVEGGLCLLKALEVPEVMRCVVLCMVEVMEGRLCSLEVPEVMRCVQGTLYV